MNLIFQAIHAVCAIIAVSDKAEALYHRFREDQLRRAMAAAERDRQFFDGINNVYRGAVIELHRDISKLERGAVDG